MILTCGKDHVLKLVDMRTYQVKQTMRAPGFTVNNTWCSATISADERHVASGSVDGRVFIWGVSFSPGVDHEISDKVLFQRFWLTSYQDSGHEIEGA